MKTKVTTNFPTNKLVFFIFNVFLLLIAASYLGIGVWLVKTYEVEKSGLDLIKEYYTNMGIVMLVVGGLSGFLALVGYILTFWRRLSILVGYLLLLIVIFLLGIAVGVLGFAYAANVDLRIDGAINESLFVGNDYDSLRLSNAIQRDFKCCGLNGPHDYINWISKQTIPASCCSNGEEKCAQEFQYKDGCLKKVRGSIFNDMLMSGAISLAIVLPTILGMVAVGALILEAIDSKHTIKYRTSKA